MNLAYTPLKPLSEVEVGDKVYLDKGDGTLPVIVEVTHTDYFDHCSTIAVGDYIFVFDPKTGKSLVETDPARVYPLAKFKIGDECWVCDPTGTTLNVYNNVIAKAYRNCEFIHNQKVCLLPKTLTKPELMAPKIKKKDLFERVQSLANRVQDMEVRLSHTVVDQDTVTAVAEPERPEPKAGQVWRDEDSLGVYIVVDTGFLFIEGNEAYTAHCNGVRDYPDDTFLAHSLEDYYRAKFEKEQQEKNKAL